MCKEDECVLDDSIVYCTEKEKFILVGNAGTRKMDGSWLQEQKTASVE